MSTVPTIEDATGKKKAGRPSLYRPEYAVQGEKLALLGATDHQIADFFDVGDSTVDDWKRIHPEFRDALKRGKLIADAEIANSLYHRGLGYSHPAVKIFMPAGAEEPTYAPYTEHYPPDTAAASLWLRNRQPEKWRDRQQVEHSGQMTLAELVLQSMKLKSDVSSSG